MVIRRSSARGLFALLALVLIGCSASTPTEQIQIRVETPVVIPSPSQTRPPTRTPTRKTVKLNPTCLVGSWHVVNLEKSMLESYDDRPSTLTLDGVQGDTIYTFDQKGMMKIAFEHLEATLRGTMDGQPVTIIRTMDGSATARYDVDTQGEQLLLLDFGGDGIVFTLNINGQTLVEGSLPFWQAYETATTGNIVNTPGPLVEYSRANVNCVGDELMIQAAEPNTGPRVMLQRIDEDR